MKRDEPNLTSDDVTESAEIEHEFGPYPGAPGVHGVSYDGTHVWFAAKDKLHAIDPNDGRHVRELPMACDAGTAFDGRFLYQLAAGSIQKIDPLTGKIVARLAAPEPPGDNAGLTWAEGTLWLTRHRERKILQLDAQSGEVLRVLASDRFVTGVTFAGDELWHATLENEESELREIDKTSGAVKRRVRMPSGSIITGLESDGGQRFFAGGGSSGRVRVLRKPKGDRANRAK